LPENVPVPVVDATARRSFNQSRMAALLAEYRQRPPARAAKPSCPDVRDQPVLQGNFGAADGSSWDSVGGEHGAGGAVGQVEDDGSNASWNRSDVGSEEAEDMGEERDMIEGREEEEAEEEAEKALQWNLSSWMSPMRGAI